MRCLMYLWYYSDLFIIWQSCVKFWYIMFELYIYKRSSIINKIIRYLPGSLIFSTSFSMLSTSCSFGEWRTMTVDPRIHSPQPILPSKFNFSFRNFDDNTALRQKKKKMIKYTSPLLQLLITRKLQLKPHPHEYFSVRKSPLMSKVF